MVSLGTWYNEDEPSASPRMFAADVGHIFSRLAAMGRRASNSTASGEASGSIAAPRKLGLWVQTLPQHFYGRGVATGTGSGTWGSSEKPPKCGPQSCSPTNDKPDWRILAAAAAAAAAGVGPEQIVPTAALLRPLHLLHKRTKFYCVLDCTHYCYHPLLWDALLDGLYRRLLNSAIGPTSLRRVPAQLSTYGPSLDGNERMDGRLRRPHAAKPRVASGELAVAQMTGASRGSRLNGRARVGGTKRKERTPGV